MIIKCKNIYGDGTVEYKEYEVIDSQTEQDEEATSEELLSILLGSEIVNDTEQ